MSHPHFYFESDVSRIPQATPTCDQRHKHCETTVPGDFRKHCFHRMAYRIWRIWVLVPRLNTRHRTLNPATKKPPLSIQQQGRVSVSYSVSRLSRRVLLCSTQPIPVTLRTTCRQAGSLIVAGVIHPSSHPRSISDFFSMLL